MGSLSPLHWLIVLLVLLLLFGSGKISTLMGDFAKGIKAFKRNMADEAETPTLRPELPASTIAGPGVPGAHTPAPASITPPSTVTPQTTSGRIG